MPLAKNNFLKYNQRIVNLDSSLLNLRNRSGHTWWWSMKILGGVHQAPLYCKPIPRELLPLIAVTAELVGDNARLC